MLAATVYFFFKIVFLILMIYIVLTWIPSINWYKEPFRTLNAFSNIFFAPFRKLIPPIGMIDISPIVAFIVWSFLARAVIYVLSALHL